MVAARTLEEALARIAELEARVAELEQEKATAAVEAQVNRMMKRRSPAQWTFRVRSWEQLPLTFQPRGETQPKTVAGLRIHIRPEDVSEGVPYWDITSKRLIALLLPLLPGLAGTNRQLEVTKNGDGPSSTYSVRISAA